MNINTTTTMGGDVSSKTEQFLKDIGVTTTKKKPCLSPVRQRPESSLSPRLKESMSMGSMKPNKISFGEVKTLVFEKEVDSHDEAHKNAVWYSKNEMKSIRKDLKKSIRKGELTRGLEQYEEDFGDETKLKRLNHVYTILELQREQRERGIYDDKGFKMLSRAMSADHIAKARKLASMDSMEALHEHQANNNPIIRTSSRSALDNLRKSTLVNVDAKRKGRFGFGVTALGHHGGTSGKNATFGTLKKKLSGPNLLLQYATSKQSGKRVTSAPGEAPVA